MASVGLVYGRLRKEEQLLIDAAAKNDIHLIPQNDSTSIIALDGGIEGDAVLVRSLSATRGLYVSRAASAWGRPVVNAPETAACCMDKMETSLRLHRAGVPTPRTSIAFDPSSALEALDQLGYPAVIKPVQGSWARMVSRVRDQEEATQILEHREMLPSAIQKVYYLQEYVDKQTAEGHRDIRAFVVGDETIAAVDRVSPHWITNTARGATTRAHPVDDELNDLCLCAAQAVGGGVLAIDLMQGPEGLTVHEINHTMEFRNSIAPSGVDIPTRILRHCIQEAKR